LSRPGTIFSASPEDTHRPIELPAIPTAAQLPARAASVAKVADDGSLQLA